ncbi:hypothetical protein LEP3755_13980 [Leptolyngbya sp. NIES-3755]|nr:hypothetical protein LEP3755_13980 [Leptolyngbya sp. NIES-3755]
MNVALANEFVTALPTIHKEKIATKPNSLNQDLHGEQSEVRSINCNKIEPLTAS